ncbi:trans-AT polyketide synthase/acyltransferase/oxidoreductase domain-containing protein [Luteibacter rhizovicinus]|uniref:[acyl-carrier-protein] S-malonyltransferase n=2 Tax=Luteibacter rhizovicinus TaxID=242606 RepID=A0A4R3YQF5_9GAMM|nr:trans-AT polyketide synthase/acyltransferase/oxidoreductase domain-containing protein [Luteibacter rhizovicinus]
MGRELFDRDKGFRTTMQHADRVMRERCGESVLGVLFAERNTRDIPLNRLLHSHCAIFMVEYALAKSLIDHGVRVDMVLGASLGAFAAAAVAGCIDPDAALLAVIEQAIALEEHGEPGCMIAVMGEPERYLTPELLALCELGARNFSTHSVISLPERNVAAVEAGLRGHGMAFQRLPVSFAFHSRWIDTARKPYQAFLQTLAFRQGNVPVICCATGTVLHTLPAGYFWSVVRDPIFFSQTLDLIESQDSYRYIDVSPGGTMATFLKYGLPVDSKSRVHHVMSPFGGDMDRLTELTAHRDGQVQNRRIPESRKMKAIIFPGQGSQFRGMGKDLFPLFPEQVRKASDILGYSLEDLCLNDRQGLLSQTQYTQPALFVVNALHYFRQRELDAANEAGPPPDFFAGHSLGEYNALLAAGVFSFETGLRLVKKRGELMGMASGGGMAAVLGTSATEIRAMLDGHDLGQIDIANFNTPAQTVIAGDKDALTAASELFSRMNLRCVTLNVSAAFHSRHMRSAQAEFAGFLQQFSFSAPEVTVIANATARPYDPARIAETLASQIATSVQWVDSIRYVMGKGDVEFHEIGGSVLSKMVHEIRTTETPILDDMSDAQPVNDPDMGSVADERASNARAVEVARETDQRAAPILVNATSLGSEVFQRRFGLKYAYMAGAMYRGVASTELVVRMGKAGFLSFFGAGGLSLQKIEANIVRIQAELNAGQPYGMNLLANYEYPSQEEAVVDLYLKYGIRNIEAAAFMQMTPALVKFRLQGLRTNTRNEIVCDHRIVAKVSRPEVAKAFMSPPPLAIVEKLLERHQITPQQAEWSQSIPVSHDICVEADSGGHTDGGIVAVMLPPLLRLRDDMQRTHRYMEPICMGLAGGIGGPEAAAAAFLLGADFVATGSINQCTVEAGMSPDGKSMLQEMDIQDTEYAPAGDMFEIGAQVQVMKKSVFFPARANKLLSLYRHYDSLDDIPARTRHQLESTFFKKTFDEIWNETASYFRSVNLDHEIVKADANAKHKMALVFRWYFAYCTRIAMEGKGDDRVNYQIQTGPALGSFNQWVKGTELEQWTKRHVDHIAIKIMDATAEHLTRSFARFLSS